MACSSSAIRKRRPVWTAGSTNNANFVAFHRLPVEQWRRVRVSLVVDGGTGQIKCTAAARYADEEQALTASTPVSLTTQVTGNGVAYGAAFATLDESKQLVEVGVDAVNTGPGTLIEMAMVTLLVDLQS